MGAGAPGASGATIVPGGGAGVGAAPTNPTNPTQDCDLYTSDLRFLDEYAVDNAAPVGRELYTWTTPEQMAELRAGSPLLTRAERPGMGAGVAFEVLSTLTTNAPTAEERELALTLTGEAFSRARYAWPHPWATRMGWPGESYGGELVRVVLREEAFLVLVRSTGLSVVDMTGAPVPIVEAILQPGRIAGFFFVQLAERSDFACWGSFFGGGGGFREFIIANAAMVQEYSGGTQEILSKLQAEISMLERLLPLTEHCPAQDAHAWNIIVACTWESMQPPSPSDPYQRAIAIPSPNYFPEEAPIRAMIETLKADLFELDPFAVVSE